MKICKKQDCVNVLTGKAVYCSDRCRQQASRLRRSVTKAPVTSKCDKQPVTDHNPLTRDNPPNKEPQIDSGSTNSDKVVLQHPPNRGILSVDEIERAVKKVKAEREGCPNDWLDRINSLPVGVVRPLFGVTGELRDRTHQQLQSSMPRTSWQSSQEYAEVIYRLLYWADEQLRGVFIPSWRAAA